MKKVFRFIYDLSVLLLARPKFQFLFERLFRIIQGYLGYGNWSSDFRLTGEKRLLLKLKEFKIGKILDIGANEGQWAIMASGVIGQEIIAFEPQSQPFIILSRQQHRKIFAVNSAVGETNGEIMINVHRESSQLSFIDDSLHGMPLLSGKAAIKETVLIYTLDYLFENYEEMYRDVDFVKIDTEGYEDRVLKGGLNFLAQVKPRFIQLEVNSHQIITKTSLYSLSLILQNYNVFKVLPGGNSLFRVVPSSPLANFLQLSTFLFVRKDIIID
jgi:FkbM family methyltransferase